ncbi:hypothetical protein ACFOOK_23825 [Micromonospora krabiensis]|uniref:hypothetical protein n=1 Tax=Micromonospora krabiensis TaxID=307121 RepID=UPI0012FD0DFF|nr:hypothetical protein [Micromonospora krabiensis]
MREMTRLAVTALALAVGLAGAATVPGAPLPAPVAELRPSAVSSHADALRSETATAVERAAEATTPTHRPIRHLATAPSGAVVDASGAAPVPDPGRSTTGRRGPPLA